MWLTTEEMLQKIMIRETFFSLDKAIHNINM